MAAPVLTHRCWNHGARPAVARCPSCSRHYCRECVTEHGGRMICASCMRAAAEQARPARRWAGATWRGAHTFLAVAIAWLVFMGVGRLLVGIPAAVHEGTLWSEPWWREDQP